MGINQGLQGIHRRLEVLWPNRDVGPTFLNLYRIIRQGELITPVRCHLRWAIWNAHKPGIDLGGRLAARGCGLCDARLGRKLGRLLIDPPSHHPPITNYPSPFPRSIMSAGPSTSTSNSNFASIFNAALKSYNRKTKKDLTSHPLLPKL